MTISDPPDAPAKAPAVHKAPASLKEKVFRGGAWAIGGLGAHNALRLVSNLIMTRLLAPEAFGLMAVAASVHYWLTMMSDIGLNSSIMRSKSAHDSAFISTAWLTQLARNCIVASLLVAIAFALGRLGEAGRLQAGTVYADPALPLFIGGVAVAVMIKSFGALRAALYQRELNFKPLIRIELSSQIVGMITMISLALMNVGPLSLLGSLIASALWSAAASHLTLKGPPIRMQFDRRHFDDIFAYGKWIMISSFFTGIVSRGDQFLFGWMLDITEFSLYAIATIWVMAGAGLVQQIVRRVTMPVFAEIHRERPRDIARIYSRLRLGVEGVSILMFAGCLIAADFGIGLLYADDYANVAHYLKLLSVGFLLLPTMLLQIVVLTAGDSRRYFLANILPAIALMAGTPLIYSAYGIDAAVVFAAMTPVSAMPYVWRAARRHMKLNYFREAGPMLLAGLAGPLVLMYG